MCTETEKVVVCMRRHTKCCTATGSLLCCCNSPFRIDWNDGMEYYNYLCTRSHCATTTRPSSALAQTSGQLIKQGWNGCATEPKLSGMAENVAETLCFRFQRAYVLVSSRLWAVVEDGCCFAVRLQAMHAFCAFTLNLLVLFAGAGRCATISGK